MRNRIAWFDPNGFIKEYYCVWEEDMDIKRKIKKVIFNDPATIVYWTDGSKTVVKTMPGDEFCPEYGLSMAICKKYFGSNSAYKRYVREWIKE